MPLKTYRILIVRAMLLHILRKLLQIMTAVGFHSQVNVMRSLKAVTLMTE